MILLRSQSRLGLKHWLDQYFSKQSQTSPGVLVQVQISGPGRYPRPPNSVSGGGVGMGREACGGPNFSDFCVLVPCQPSHHISECPGGSDASTNV